MDDHVFPSEIGGYLSGKSFKEVFEGSPKITEFVDSLWDSDKTTGLFKLFFVYIKNCLAVPFLREQHESRCFAYVDSYKEDLEMPPYMAKYIRMNSINTI